VSGTALRFSRGSGRRLRRLRLRGNSSLELWVFVVALLFALSLVAWLAIRPSARRRDPGPALEGSLELQRAGAPAAAMDSSSPGV
jgi:hypothetical protein